MLQRLKSIPYDSLPISDYSRNYILRLLPQLDYYLEIYQRCLRQMLRETGLPKSEIVMVDYGDGHGFLSLTAKEMGIGQIIYVDFNPQAVHTIKTLTEKVGFGPDIILEGDSTTLRQWCLKHNVTPNLLLGMDVIEHIYRLDSFFENLYAINPSLPMLFTTGSTPFNRHAIRRLHRIMQADELGHGNQLGFHTLRKMFILSHYPLMSECEAEVWASNTRGLTYTDIPAAIESLTPNKMSDPYNTCDPATGSWTERILPIKDYQTIVNPYHAKVSVQNGFFNTHRTNIKGIASQLFNLLLRLPLFRSFAPFITLIVKT